MIASAVSDLSGLIVAVALLLVAVTGLLIRRSLGHVKASVGNVALEVSQVNQAVNNVKPGTPPLTERVATLEHRLDKHVTWNYDAWKAAAEHIGFELPPGGGG